MNETLRKEDQTWKNRTVGRIDSLKTTLRKKDKKGQLGKSKGKYIGGKKDVCSCCIAVELRRSIRVVTGSNPDQTNVVSAVVRS